MGYEAIVIGASAGGMEAIGTILRDLEAKFPIPIIIVQHVSPYSDNYMCKHLDKLCRLSIKEVEENEKPCSGTAYIAPPNYHILVERDRSLSLSVEPKVNYARPSIDILFESAAEAYMDGLIGIILTGANSDRSKGLRKIKKMGGLTIVQAPHTAVMDLMPRAAIDATEVDFIVELNKIGSKLVEIVGGRNV